MAADDGIHDLGDGLLLRYRVDAYGAEYWRKEDLLRVMRELARVIGTGKIDLEAAALAAGHDPAMTDAFLTAWSAGAVGMVDGVALALEASTSPPTPEETDGS